MFVVTADQHRSRETGDRVRRLLEDLSPWADERAEHILLPLERTVGDEVQIVLSDAETALDFTLQLVRAGDWAIGVGAGPADLPLGSSPRQSSGEVFIHARNAVERARGKAEPVPVVVEGANNDAAGQATAVLQLLAAVVRRRSAEGWAVADRQAQGMNQAQIAADLGISPQAVSKRARTAMVEEERRARPVVAALISAAEGHL